MAIEFHYRTGEMVCVGDHVRSVGGRPGNVKEIILPETEIAKQFSCLNGGVMIIEDWDGVSSPRILALTDEDWDDLSLLKRA